MNILVTGGAGYVGSHTVRALKDNNYGVVVFDNLSKGHAKAVPAGVPLVVGNFWDEDLLARTIRKYEIDVIIHFAASEYYASSRQKSTIYFNSNVVGMLAVIDAMKTCGVDKIVLSSTTALYGDAISIPLTEEMPLTPSTMYGRTKFVVERMLADNSQANHYSYVSLRYSNAAGASLDGTIGEDHYPEFHFIPLAMMAALGQSPAVEIFGSDYPTPDGTYIHDYVHVVDVADAHVRAIKYLEAGGASRVYNVGINKGYSVREVIDRVQAITGIPVPTKELTRRDGTPAILVTSCERISSELGWVPQYSDLDTIIKTAWLWHKSYPRGYERRNLARKNTS